VAQLARSFNHAADRIARLVNAQRTMLAGASHELRSPLARIRIPTVSLSVTAAVVISCGHNSGQIE
jgi:signal transduction histidine kinase